MNFLPSFLEGFSPELYLATLAQVAHSDGLHHSEEAFLNQQAANLGLELEKLPEVPHDLSELPWATRILVYRDALMLSYADGQQSEEEKTYLLHLATRLHLQKTIISEITTLVNDYSNLLNRLENILKEPRG